MGKVEQIEREIQELSPAELSVFREWYASFVAEAWDRQIERDAATGKLDALSDKALKALSSGGCSRI
jgi:hypothetical protein